MRGQRESYTHTQRESDSMTPRSEYDCDRYLYVVGLQ